MQMSAAVIGAISATLSIIRYLVEYAQSKKMIDAATAEVLLKNLVESDDAIARAKKARDAVRSRATNDPTSVLRDDDGFRRRDE